MALVTSTEMFKKAYDGGYAIGAFNVNNMEIVQGITEACKEEHAPVILQVSKGARAYANHTYLVKLVEAAVIECPVRVGSSFWLSSIAVFSFSLTSACVFPRTFFVMTFPSLSYPAVYRPSQRPSFRLRMLPSPLARFLLM